jgi:hypothetical protein
MGASMKWVVPKDIHGVPIIEGCVVVSHYPHPKIYGRVDYIEFTILNDRFSCSIVNKKNLRYDRYVEVIDGPIELEPIIEALSQRKIRSKHDHR